MNGFDRYMISYQKIVTDTNMLSSTRLLAAKLQQTTYITVKDFLQDLSNDELFDLIEAADSLILNNDNSTHCQDIVLISEMLTRAEGLASSTEDDIFQHTRALCTFVACEGLARRGLVKVFRENMSFGEDMVDKIIIERLPGTDYTEFEVG